MPHPVLKKRRVRPGVCPTSYSPRPALPALNRRQTGLAEPAGFAPMRGEPRHRSAPAPTSLARPAPHAFEPGQ